MCIGLPKRATQCIESWFGIPLRADIRIKRRNAEGENKCTGMCIGFPSLATQCTFRCIFVYTALYADKFDHDTSQHNAHSQGGNDAYTAAMLHTRVTGIATMAL